MPAPIGVWLGGRPTTTSTILIFRRRDAGVSVFLGVRLLYGGLK